MLKTASTGWILEGVTQHSQTHLPTHTMSASSRGSRAAMPLLRSKSTPIHYNQFLNL